MRRFDGGAGAIGTTMRRWTLAWLAALVVATGLAPAGDDRSPVPPVAAQDDATPAATPDATPAATPLAATAEERQERRRRRARNGQAEETPANTETETGDADLGTPTPEAPIDYDCVDFTTREEAQAVLDQDPTDPYNLDPSGDGVACALLPSAADVAQTAPPPADATLTDEPAADGGGRRRNRTAQDTTDPAAALAESVSNCARFASQEDALAELKLDPSDPLRLDPDGDGLPCEADELAGGAAPAAATEEPAPADNRRRNRDTTAGGTADVAAPEDIDCIDFATQEEAQTVFDQNPADPFNLDPNGDGFACSSLPSAGGPRVSAVPNTGTGRVVPPAVVLPILLAAAGAGLWARGRVRRGRSHPESG